MASPAGGDANDQYHDQHVDATDGVRASAWQDSQKEEQEEQRLDALGCEL
jgi:hypothetical protein